MSVVERQFAQGSGELTLKFLVLFHKATLFSNVTITDDFDKYSTSVIKIIRSSFFRQTSFTSTQFANESRNEHKPCMEGGGYRHDTFGDSSFSRKTDIIFQIPSLSKV